ncbi:MAG TPA: hypothetical protein VM487_12170 [Phycisphaerae bacterium]|nr:hypothetical protein [Phycisphaerae bacterium]
MRPLDPDLMREMQHLLNRVTASMLDELADHEQTDEATAAPNPDPWKHRSRMMSCATCMYCVPKVRDVESTAAPLGRCRRHAPTIAGYPVVFFTDFCGDHKLDENKT